MNYKILSALFLVSGIPLVGHGAAHSSISRRNALDIGSSARILMKSAQKRRAELESKQKREALPKTEQEELEIIRARNFGDYVAMAQEQHATAEASTSSSTETTDTSSHLEAPITFPATTTLPPVPQSLDDDTSTTIPPKEDALTEIKLKSADCHDTDDDNLQDITFSLEISAQKGTTPGATPQQSIGIITKEVQKKIRKIVPPHEWNVFKTWCEVCNDCQKEQKMPLVIPLTITTPNSTITGEDVVTLLEKYALSQNIFEYLEKFNAAQQVAFVEIIDKHCALSSLGKKIFNHLTRLNNPEDIKLLCDLATRSSVEVFTQPHYQTTFVVPRLAAPQFSPDGQYIALLNPMSLYIYKIEDYLVQNDPIAIINDLYDWSPENAFFRWDQSSQYLIYQQGSATDSPKVGIYHVPTRKKHVSDFFPGYFHLTNQKMSFITLRFEQPNNTPVIACVGSSNGMSLNYDIALNLDRGGFVSRYTEVTQKTERPVCFLSKFHQQGRLVFDPYSSKLSLNAQQNIEWRHKVNLSEMNAAQSLDGSWLIVSNSTCAELYEKVGETYKLLHQLPGEPDGCTHPFLARWLSPTRFCFTIRYGKHGYLDILYQIDPTTKQLFTDVINDELVKKRHEFIPIDSRLYRHSEAGFRNGDSHNMLVEIFNYNAQQTGIEKLLNNLLNRLLSSQPINQPATPSITLLKNTLAEIRKRKVASLSSSSSSSSSSTTIS